MLGLDTFQESINRFVDLLCSVLLVHMNGPGQRKEKICHYKE